MGKREALLIYGEGGHRAEMRALFDELLVRTGSKIQYFGMYENSDNIDALSGNVELPVIRDKFSLLKTFFNCIYAPWIIIFKTLRIDLTRSICVVISVGPGISILPCLYYKIFRGKVTIIYLENSCKYRWSYTGRLMHILADHFFVQDTSLLSVYSKAVYAGKLL